MIDDQTVRELADTATSTASELTAHAGQVADSTADTLRKNVGLTLAGGVAIGLAVGAMLPLGRRRKRKTKAARVLVTNLAASVAELTQTLAAQARERAETATEDARKNLGDASRVVGKELKDQSETLGKRSKKLADDAAGGLNDSGKVIARAIVKLVEKVRN